MRTHFPLIKKRRRKGKWLLLAVVIFQLTIILHHPVAAQKSDSPQKNSPQKDSPLFQLMNEKETGLKYLNMIREDDSLHVMRYEYLYNGAGVGIADFNNDGLNDIFFSGNTGPHKLFLNNGNFRFADITRQAGTGGNGTWGTGVSLADVNGDGLMDIYVCHSGKYEDPARLSNELFICQEIKDGIPVFKDLAKEYGLDAPGTQSTQAVFFDYDKDGDLDMFLLNHSNHTYNPFLNTRKQRSTPDFNFGNRLFRNDRDANGTMHFTDVTLQAGIINNALNFGLSVTVSDVDGDGWPDLYTTSDYTEKDCFYLNNRDGTFTETLERSFTHISKYSMGADIADYNNDGRPDVLTLDMLPEDNHRQKLLKGADEYDQYHLLLDSGYYHQQMRNMLHLNQGTDEKGQLRFSEIGQLAGVSNTDWSWAGLLADFDNDGWKDLFISNGYLRDFTDLDFLKYKVPDAKVQALKKGQQQFQTYDLVKLMPSNKISNYIFHNNKDLTFSNTTLDWGLARPSVSNAAAYGDLDDDGDLDLIVCNNNEPAMVYRNNENEVKQNHYIKLRLKGTGMNTKAYGAKATLITADGIRQFQELYPVRGYQSTVAPELFFGFPKGQSVKEIRITWPDGRITSLKEVAADQTLELKQEDALSIERDVIPAMAKDNNKDHQDNNKDHPGRSPVSLTELSGQKTFVDITQKSGLVFRHKENDFVDFKDEVLLPYQLSRQGPALAKGDVNGDGLEDIFIGGAIGQAGRLFLQTTDGRFVSSLNQPWNTDTLSEQVNALFFDADNDGDADLYVVCGGNEYADRSPEYQDRLYINDGKGHFTRAPDALPSMVSSKFAISAGDYDGDGDLDLFIGGRGLPGSFPMASDSYLLRNDSKGGIVRFTDVTDEICPSLRLPGMITAAQWVDIDNDGKSDLVIAGDWMPVKIYRNNKVKLTDITAEAGLSGLTGMWSSITAADVNGDGKTDFILGNCGFNNQFKASAGQPMTLYAADFDDNGTIDPILCYYIQGKSYPAASRDELLDQIVPLRKKFVNYSGYADATIGTIFPKDKLDKAKQFRCEELATGILYNLGNNKWHFSPLPLQAQFSKVFGALVDDFDKDGIKDILLSGNFYPYRAQLGRCDASLGMFLKGGNLNGGTGAGYSPIDPSLSGCFLGGDIRGMVSVKNRAGETMIIVAKNDDGVQVISTQAIKANNK